MGKPDTNSAASILFLLGREMATSWSFLKRQLFKNCYLDVNDVPTISTLINTVINP